MCDTQAGTGPGPDVTQTKEIDQFHKTDTDHTTRRRRNIHFSLTATYTDLQARTKLCTFIRVDGHQWTLQLSVQNASG